MKPNKKIASLLVLGVSLLGLPVSAFALPSLQLDILGGTYASTGDNSNPPTPETTVAPEDRFTLYAYADDNPNLSFDDILGPDDTLNYYYLSVALIPKPDSQGDVPTDLGSISINGTPIQVTADMAWGTPPLDDVLAATDPGDLASHGIFETYYYEVGFDFGDPGGTGVDAPKYSADYNVQDDTGQGPQTVTDNSKRMLYQSFNIDVSNLKEDWAVHFDLYNQEVVNCSNNPNCTAGDIDVDDFAPFSHDAESLTYRDGGSPPAGVPEPNVLALLALGLIGSGLASRRRSNPNPAT